MANEITLVVQIQQTKNGRTFTDNTGGLTYTQTGNGVSSGVYLVSDSAAVAIPLAGIVEPESALLRNLDDTNFVTLGYDNTGFVPVMKIRPGQCVLVNLDGVLAVPQLKADTNDCLVSYSIFDR